MVKVIMMMMIVVVMVMIRVMVVWVVMMTNIFTFRGCCNDGDFFQLVQGAVDDNNNNDNNDNNDDNDNNWSKVEWRSSRLNRSLRPLHSFYLIPRSLVFIRPFLEGFRLGFYPYHYLVLFVDETVWSYLCQQPCTLFHIRSISINQSIFWRSCNRITVLNVFICQPVEISLKTMKSNFIQQQLRKSIVQANSNVPNQLVLV